ncbi:hypothetical protein [Microbacterium ginsengisoli]
MSGRPRVAATVATIAISAALLGVGAQGIQLASAQARLDAVDAALVTAKTDVQAATLARSEAVSRSISLTSVAAARATLITAIASAENALREAGNTVDVGAEKATVRRAQLAALDPQPSLALLVSARAVVDGAASSATARAAADAAAKAAAAARAAAEKAAAQAAAAARPPAPAPAPVDPYTLLRAELDSVGGAAFPLVMFDGHCGDVTTDGCSYPDGHIGLSPSVASLPPARRHWILIHEMAHQYQFHVWSTLMASPSFHALFGDDLELLANCMPEVRGVRRSFCNATQQTWAAGIWNGVVNG